MNLDLFNEILGLPGGASGKEFACQWSRHKRFSSISGLGISPGVGNGNSFHYSCLENSMDRGTWQATINGVSKSLT